MAKYGNWDGEGSERAEEDDRTIRVTIEAINDDGTTEELWQKDGDSLMLLLIKDEGEKYFAQCTLLGVTDHQIAGAIIANPELAEVRKLIMMSELAKYKAGQSNETKH